MQSTAYASVLLNCKLFLEKIGAKGFLTCLGMRTTIGSCFKLYPMKFELYDGFTKNNMPLKEGEPINPKKKSVLTVGARALTKHANRSSEVINQIEILGSSEWE